MALKKRLVVVGAGSIGTRHARLLATRQEVAVELCDPDPKALQDALGALGKMPVHTSFEDMLNTGPDMVLIASPHHLHVPQTLRALESGADVLCEKPMSDRLDTAVRVLELAGKTDRILSYGFSNHFNPGMIRIKEAIDEGLLGDILYVHFHIGTYGTLVNSRSRYQENTEGALLMDYVHQPDLLCWMLGRNPKGVFAAGSTGGRMALKASPNALTMLLDYDAALTASIHLNYLQSPDRYHCEFVGDRGWLYYDLSGNTILQGDAHRQSVRKEAFQFERDAIYVAEHQAFLDAVAGKRLPESPAEEAIQSMIVLEAALQSWKTRTRIALDHVY